MTSRVSGAVTITTLVRGLTAVVLIALFALAFYLVSRHEAVRELLDTATLQETVATLGIAGPLTVVALMSVAIVLSPIPSAPIALAAGSLYGHLWGTTYVAVGALLGALTAFGIARFIARARVTAWLERQGTGSPLRRFMHSQNALMAVVFATRLMPFLSFDMISYAAGVTPLSAWRFGIATLVGIVPASFLLAHFGAELASGEADRILLTVLVLGAFTLLSVAIGTLRWRAHGGGLRRYSNDSPHGEADQ